MMKKRYYQSPRVTLVNVDQEGLICDSVRLNVRIKELDNMNYLEEGEEASEEFFFKS